jgi:hypothetical protein
MAIHIRRREIIVMLGGAVAWATASEILFTPRNFPPTSSLPETIQLRSVLRGYALNRVRGGKVPGLP